MDLVGAYVAVLDRRGWPDSLAELDNLEPDDAAFVVIVDANAAIGNGGFADPFYNPRGWFAGRLPDAAARFGLSVLEVAARHALSLFGDRYPSDFTERDARWDEICRVRGAEADRIVDAASEAWYDGERELYATLAGYARSRLPPS